MKLEERERQYKKTGAFLTEIHVAALRSIFSRYLLFLLYTPDNSRVGRVVVWWGR